MRVLKDAGGKAPIASFTVSMAASFMVSTAGSATIFTVVSAVVSALDTGAAEEADIVNRAEALRALRQLLHVRRIDVCGRVRGNVYETFCG
jgi:hypothetical protein